MVRGVKMDDLFIEYPDSRPRPFIKIRWNPCQCGSNYFLKYKQHIRETWRPQKWRHRFRCVKCDKDNYSDWYLSWSTGGGGVFLAHQKRGEAI